MVYWWNLLKSIGIYSQLLLHIFGVNVTSTQNLFHVLYILVQINFHYNFIFTLGICLLLQLRFRILLIKLKITNSSESDFLRRWSLNSLMVLFLNHQVSLRIHIWVSYIYMYSLLLGSANRIFYVSYFYGFYRLWWMMRSA